jgi:hypothetical protein
MIPFVHDGVLPRPHLFFNIMSHAKSFCVSPKTVNGSCYQLSVLALVPIGSDFRSLCCGNSSVPYFLSLLKKIPMPSYGGWVSVFWNMKVDNSTVFQNTCMKFFRGNWFRSHGAAWQKHQLHRRHTTADQTCVSGQNRKSLALHLYKISFSLMEIYFCRKVL